jgi:methylthioribose-1-phosphate isomerase
LIHLDSLALRFERQDSKVELWILDQTLLPQQEVWLQLKSTSETIEAIRALRVRGAPLIGVVAALNVVQSALLGADQQTLLAEVQALYEARPTAVNLMICMERMRQAISTGSSVESIVDLGVEIFAEDRSLCDRMADHGAALIQDGDSILTHCNTGGLATAGVGTALGVIRRAAELGKKIHVYVDETRPLLQGGRLTAWELKKLNIPFTLITDNMAGHLMSLGKIQKALVGCDRIAANGDFANKIGTYSVAVLCHFHRIPFYVVGPYTTIDWTCVDGSRIPIEERSSAEVLGVAGSFGQVTWAPSGSPVYNPAFDVTPAHLVMGWVLDYGVFNKSDFETGEVKSCLQS